MADNYRLCPCGSGKKVKYCCKGMAQEVETVTNLLKKEQRAAAIQQLEQLIQKHGELPQLLNLKVVALIESDRTQDAEEMVLKLLQIDPDSPRPYAFAAILDVVKGNVDDAVAQLQRSLARIGEGVGGAEVVDAISMVAIAVAQAEGGYKARAHLALWVANSNQEAAARPMRMLMDLDEELHPLLQLDPAWFEPPEDADWADEYQKARDLSAGGAWLEAANRLDQIARANPDEVRLRRVRAFVLGCASPHEEMIRALRDFAAHDKADFDDAVEAEAVAQLLESDSVGLVDQVKKSIDVTEPDRAMEAMLSDETLHTLDTNMLGIPPGQPRPKGLFLILSAAPPEEGVERTVENTPRIVGQVTLFGRQTDREAFVEVVGLDNGDFEAAERAVRATLENELGESGESETVDQQLGLRVLVSTPLLLTPDIPVETQEKIRIEALEDVVFNKWPQLANAQLSGKSPEEAAKDPANRIRIAASLTLLEASILLGHLRVDTNPLRERLGLPVIDSENMADINETHRLHYSYVNVAKLDDEQLMQVIRSGMSRSRRLLATEAVREAIQRGMHEKEEDLTLAALYDLLGRWTQHESERRQLVSEAKEIFKEDRKALAPWLIRELVLSIESSDGETARSLLDRLTSEYANDEGVMQMVMQVLAQYGLLNDSVGPRPPAEPAASSSDIALQMAQEDSPGGALWTPDTPGPPPQGGNDDDDKPSKLWVPGMD